MKDCLTASTERAPLNPTKRVNYNFGMVLGVDDFCQEQAHFEWKHRISNLLLHGFGTVCGLQVTASAVTDPSDVLIRVSAGYGISREGKWMWVDRDLCARLGEWLGAHGDDLSPALGAGRYTVYITLCYAECPTDLVPIAGQPCASDEDTRAPSRIQEAYQVEFSWNPPAQLAEDVVRAFGDLMVQVEIVSDGTGSPSVDDAERLLGAVQALVEMGAPLASPPLASPPVVDMGPFRLLASTACDTIRQALVVWATEVCPRLHAPLKPGEKDCILLACVDFDVDVNGELDFSLDPEGNLLPGSVAVDNCTRPVLVPDRLKQELFCLAMDVNDHGRLDPFALDDLTDVNAPSPSANDILVWQERDLPRGRKLKRWETTPHVLNNLSDVETSGVVDGHVLMYQGDQWVAAESPAGVSDRGNFVHALSSSYAIVAAGYFRPDGTPVKPDGITEGTSYNGLEAEPEGTGRYRLRFPLYGKLLDAGVTYIVKGTIVDPSLSSYEEYLENLYEIRGDPFEYLYEPDKPVLNPYNLGFPSMTPATFQVVELGGDGILVWITQPRLRYGLFKALAREEIDMGDDMNVILFTPVDKAFMVEISAYSPDLDWNWNEYFSTYPDRVNVNTASIEELRSLPRIGPALAIRIVKLRDEVGGFTSLDQLKDVQGIDEFLVSRLRHLMRL